VFSGTHPLLLLLLSLLLLMRLLSSQGKQKSVAVMYVGSCEWKRSHGRHCSLQKHWSRSDHQVEKKWGVVSKRRPGNASRCKAECIVSMEFKSAAEP
jgi:hypothetical protein